MTKEKKQDKPTTPTELRVRETPFFKLAKKSTRSFQIIDLRKQFGFIPERIVIERMTSRNNVIRIVAILTEEEIKKEKALSAKITGKKQK